MVHSETTIPKIDDFFIKINGIYIKKDETVLSKKIIDSLANGSYEFYEARNLPYILQPGEVVLELGGGIGFLSTICAKDPRVKKVITVEANKRLIPLIKKTHLINGVAHKTLVINAVAEPNPKKDTIPFYIREDFWASSTLPTPWAYEKVVNVPVIDLNMLIKKYSPTLLIVDIEGKEADLFSIFNKIYLKGVNKIYIEIHQEVLGREGVRQLFKKLTDMNYHYDVWHSEKNVVLFSHVNRDKNPPNVNKIEVGSKIKRPPLLNIKGVDIYRDPWRPLRFISPKGFNIVYVNNPKSACTTIQNIIYFLVHNKFPEVDISVHQEKSDMIAYWKNENDQAYFKDLFASGKETLFTFVRNPFKRSFSAFYDKIVLTYDINYAPLREELKNNFGLDMTDWQMKLEKGYDLFLEYLFSLIEKYGYIKDPHFAPQIQNIRFGEIPYDVIGKVESFKEDLLVVFDKAGIQVVDYSIFDFLTHTTKDEAYKNYKLTSKQRDMVYKLYAEDFDAFYPELVE